MIDPYIEFCLIVLGGIVALRLLNPWEEGWRR